MKITIISWDNLGYISLVEKEMQRQGHEVHHIKMNELNYAYKNTLDKIKNAFTKVVLKHNKKREILAQNVHNKLNKLPHQDMILVVSADWLPTSFISKIRQKTNRLIAWFYDAVANYPRIPKMISHFDRAYTFEKADAEKYGMHFLPNFNPYNTPHTNENRKPFVFHISSERRNRIKILTEIAQQLIQHQVNYEIHLITKNEYDNNFISISRNPMALHDVYKNLKDATMQIDIQRERQNGLSFRVFEAMGLQQKLITTNQEITHYDFYNPHNIQLINEKNIILDAKFLNSDYQIISHDIYQRYTLENWVKKIIL